MTAVFLSGFLKIAAVAVVTAGIGGGVYLVAERGTADDRQGAPATLQEPLSPPNQIGGPPAETPTPAGPIPTPPAIDTSDWLTYSSPLGFTIKHPPGWVVRNRDIPELPPGRVSIVNDRIQELAPLRDDHNAELFFGGEAWFEILTGGFNTPFDADFLIDMCGAGEEDIPVPGVFIQANRVTFAGLPAVQCLQEGPTMDGEHRMNSEVYWVGLPSRGFVHIAGHAVDGDEATFQLLRTLLSIVSFEGTP